MYPPWNRTFTIAGSIFFIFGLAVWPGCSKKITSIRESAPGAVYDSLAQSKQFAVVATGDQPWIDDLEDGDLSGLKLEGRAWSWSQFDDHYDGVQLLTIVQVEDAPGMGRNVLYVKGGDWKKKGAGFSAYLVSQVHPRPFAFYDASVYLGIRFWIRATGLDSMKVLIGTPETTSVDDGGVCLKNCPEDPEVTFQVSEEWRLVTAPFPSFLRPGFKESGLLDATRVKAIHFSMETLGDYEVWLDDLEFYTE